MPQNLLEQLRKYTVVVADTGDIEAMEKFRPQDATTNPSLITAAAQMPQYQPIVDGVLMDARKELGEGAERSGSGEPCVPAAGDCVRQEDSGDCAGARFNRSGRAACPTTPRERSSRRAALLRNTMRRASGASASWSRLLRRGKAFARRRCWRRKASTAT